MGYFSNGTEGECYEAAYCDRCIHQDGPDGESGCAIWLAHLMHNYDECNKPDSILHLLIPLSKNGHGNEQCLLFHERHPASERQQLVDILAADKAFHRA